jgi:shikimate kinase
MGSGKTTVGPTLASKLGYQFIDQDDLIVEHYSMSIADVFAKFGEAKFRKTEHDVLVDVVTKDNLVISTGGGAPCFFNNMEFMNRFGITVYLKAEPATLMNRLRALTDSRPLLKGKTEPELMQFITDKLNEREPYYLKAKLSLPTDSLNADEVIEKIIEFSLNNH